MLRSVSELKGCTIGALDGEVGKVEELFFDDEAWGVRYLVVKAGTWLTGREVLISPFSVKRADLGTRVIEVSLTREQVKNSPPVDTHKPVSRQHERDYLGYYGYPPYWGGSYLWGVTAFPLVEPVSPVSPVERELTARMEAEQAEDSRLRSTDDVKGYHIQAIDDSIGHVEDFLFDDEAWAIRYLVVDTTNWWPGGKKVLVATQWISSIAWPDRKVYTKLTRDDVKRSPEYDDTAVVSREYEARLHDFYGRPGYWD